MAVVCQIKRNFAWHSLISIIISIDRIRRDNVNGGCSTMPKNPSKNRQKRIFAPREDLWKHSEKQKKRHLSLQVERIFGISIAVKYHLPRIFRKDNAKNLRITKRVWSIPSNKQNLNSLESSARNIPRESSNFKNPERIFGIIGFSEEPLKNGGLSERNWEFHRIQRMWSIRKEY